MSSGTVRVERRSAQRFDFHIPVTIRVADEQSGAGVTYDLSASGMLVYTDMPLTVDSVVELTLVMPAEITMADNMRVRCRGRVLRVSPPNSATKAAVALHLERYEVLTEAATSFPVTKDLNRAKPLQDEISH